MRVRLSIGIIALLGASTAAAQTTQDLKRMDLEELLSINVTTVSRAPETTIALPAAIHVITEDDIRRSGATSIPEVLRLAPGMQVARINAGTWSIGMRGFADRLARSMLVLIDGRAVYSPLFAGTYWEVQDTLLEDVERIEIIRGPGGTLWGANAVTGIINIITKPARNSAGVLATASAGSSERGSLAFRYGGALNGGWHYRAYLKAFDRDAQFHADSRNFDGLRLVQGGFRADWTPSASRTLALQGDLYTARLGQRPTVALYTPPYSQTREIDAPLSGANVLARWSEALGGDSSLQLQTFYNRTNRDEIPVSENRDTFDVDFQHTLRRWRRHQLTWGLGYRVSSGRITAVEPTQFVPDDRTDNLYHGFLHDDIEIVRNRLNATIGTKVERNDYTGTEVQPGGRLAWTPSATQTVWWAVTRAVRTPSRVETDYTTTSLVTAAGPTFVRLQPNRDFTSEELVAYESGYRIRPADRAYLTVSGFYNVHDDVLSTEILAPFVEPAASPARVIIPVTFANGLDGRSYGLELSGDVRPAAWWRLTSNYSYLQIEMSRQPGSADGSQERRNEGQSPHHQLQVQSSVDIGPRWSVDAFVRYVSELPAAAIPSYWTTNVRLAWHVAPQLEIAAVGQDLNRPHHVEWPGGSGTNVEIRRSAYVKVTWRR
jgi:iron complex outermembrane receptor protein